MQETPFSNDSYPLALTYINWETDAIVGIELIRNVSMALGIKTSSPLLVVSVVSALDLVLHENA